MSKRGVERAHRLPAGARGQIRGFTKQSQQQVYQGAIRQLKRAYGYGDTPITLRNAEVLARIDAWAGKQADDIYTVYNRMLHNALARMPAGLPDADYTARLAPLFAGIHQYNQQTLVPFATRWARQQAVNDFTQRNNLTDLWDTQPKYTTSAEGEACALAISLPPRPYDQLTDMPNHQNCFHTNEPVPRSPMTSPNAADLWDGSQP